MLRTWTNMQRLTEKGDNILRLHKQTFLVKKLASLLGYLLNNTRLFDHLNLAKLNQNPKLEEMLTDIRYGSKFIPDSGLQKVYMSMFGMLGPMILERLDNNKPSTEMEGYTKWVMSNKMEIVQHVNGVLFAGVADQGMQNQQQQQGAPGYQYTWDYVSSGHGNQGGQGMPPGPGPQPGTGFGQGGMGGFGQGGQPPYQQYPPTGQNYPQMPYTDPNYNAQSPGGNPNQYPQQQGSYPVQGQMQPGSEHTLDELLEELRRID